MPTMIDLGTLGSATITKSENGLVVLTFPDGRIYYAWM